MLDKQLNENVLNMKKNILAMATATLCSIVNTAQAEPVQPNVVLITADDLGYEVMQLFRDNLPQLTPNISEYAADSFQFRHAYANTAICQPSRAIIATGLYGVSSGMMGFFHLRDNRTPTLMQTLSDNGYRTGILDKIEHSTPNMNYRWDYQKSAYDLTMGRNPELFYQYSSEFIADSKESGQPFYLMVNSRDPHRPFHDPDNPLQSNEWKPFVGKVPHPSKLFSPDEVQVPGYLPDIPKVRLELSHYYNSVRRLDDTFGRVIDALEEQGVADNTLVMFMSDNGSPFPFAKANAYMASNRSAFIVRWPEGGIKQRRIDDDHMISYVDIFPTILAATGIKLDTQLDGRSFLPVLRGEKQTGRDYVISQIDYKLSGSPVPMRAVQTKKYTYLFNPWSQEGANYSNNNEGGIIKAMEATGRDDLQERVRIFRDRTVEEFYDVQSDPDSLNNLISDNTLQPAIEYHRRLLLGWMEKHQDPVLPVLQMRHKPEFLPDMLEASYPDRNSLTPPGQVVRDARTKARRAAYLEKQAKKA